MARKGLGRGLEAILGDVGEAPPRREEAQDAVAKAGVRRIPLGDIAPDPEQPRKSFDEESLEELAASIKAQGLLQPVLVRPGPSGAGYLLIAGERRWRASGKAGLHEIPALIMAVDDAKTAELALIENLQRRDLNPMEEADAFARLRDMYGAKPQEIGDAVGKSRSHVANMLRLTTLPDQVRAHVMAGDLSMGHARALLAAADPVVLADEVIARGLSVRETERRAAKTGTGTAASNSASPSKKPSSGSGGAKDADTKALERDLAATLGLEVNIDHGKKGGRIEIGYDTLEQLDDLCRRLMGSSI